MPDGVNGPACIVCGSATRPAYEKGGSEYHRCDGCGLLFLHPLPDPGEMQGFAEAEYSGGAYEEYARARDLKMATFRDRCAVIERYVPRGRLLDVGAACGFMIDVALESGYDAYGVEFSAAAIAQASDEAQPRIFQESVDALDTASLGVFDLVTAFDIVEHSLAPIGFLRSLTRLLRPGGFVVLSTPDVDHFLRHVMRARWPHLQPLQHTYLFSRESMRLALAQSGLELVSIGSASKVLSLDYLATQVEQHNPVAHRAYHAGAKVLPERVRRHPLRVRIGEMLVVARWDGARNGEGHAPEA
jgi:SAM-dependent methyltransferase